VPQRLLVMRSSDHDDLLEARLVEDDGHPMRLALGASSFAGAQIAHNPWCRSTRASLVCSTCMWRSPFLAPEVLSSDDDILLRNEDRKSYRCHCAKSPYEQYRIIPIINQDCRGVRSGHRQGSARAVAWVAGWATLRVLSHRIGSWGMVRLNEIRKAAGSG
jgi:hypothetical protein